MKRAWEVARSQAYSVSLDFTPPQAVGLLDYPDAPGTCLIASTDALSGIAGFSVDGGETWVETNGEPVYLYAGEPGSVLAVGTVLARDMAGNISSNAEEYVFPEEAEPTPENRRMVAVAVAAAVALTTCPLTRTKLLRPTMAWN